MTKKQFRKFKCESVFGLIAPISRFEFVFTLSPLVRLAIRVFKDEKCVVVAVCGELVKPQLIGFDSLNILHLVCTFVYAYERVP